MNIHLANSAASELCGFSIGDCGIVISKEQARELHRQLSPLFKSPADPADQPSETGITSVLYDGPDAVELTATPYRRVHYPEFRDPKVSKVMVSPARLLEICERPFAKTHDV